MGTDDKRRIEKLKDKLKIKTRRIEELRGKLTSSANPIQRLSNPIQRLREHAEDYVNVIEHWKEAFKMVQNERRVVAWAVHGRNTMEHRFNIEHPKQRPGRQAQ